MTFDERLDRLTERHEALSQSVELFLMSTRENADRMAAMITSNMDSIRLVNDDISKLIAVSTSLMRVAESHERRIVRIEGERT